MDAMSRSTNASMQTMTRNDINIPSDNSAATVTTTNTDIRGELQTAADDLRQLIKEAEKQKEVVRTLYKNINDQAAKIKSLIERHRADAAQRFSDLNESSTTIQTTITTKTSEAVCHLDAHSTSIKHDLNGIYETMKSDLEQKIKSIDTRSSTSLHAINHSSDKCKGNHDHVENKLKSYIASKIKELNKSIPNLRHCSKFNRQS